MQTTPTAQRAEENNSCDLKHEGINKDRQPLRDDCARLQHDVHRDETDCGTATGCDLTCSRDHEAATNGPKKEATTEA